MENESVSSSLSVSFALDTTDIDALQRYATEREKEKGLPGKQVRWLLVVTMLMIVLVAAPTFLRDASRPQPVRRLMTDQNWLQPLAPSAVVIAFLVPSYLWAKNASRKALHNQPGDFFAPRTVTISEGEYREKLPGSEFSHDWTVMGEIRDRPDHILFGLPEHNGVEQVYLVPKHAFDSREEEVRFLERARAFRRATRARTVVP